MLHVATVALLGALRGSDRLPRCELRVDVVGPSEARERAHLRHHARVMARLERGAHGRRAHGRSRQRWWRSRCHTCSPHLPVALSSLHAPSPQGVSVVVVAVSVFHVRRLIVVLNCDPLPSTLHAVRYLKPSSPFVVFSQYLEVPGLGGVVWPACCSAGVEVVGRSVSPLRKIFLLALRRRVLSLCAICRL